MSDFPPRDPNETQQFSAPGGGAPPTMTAPIPMPLPPPRGRNFLIFLLVLLLGLGGGFAASQIFGQRSEKLPDPKIVLYENASTSFPIDGAAFTTSTFDPTRRQCDKELLKQYLRADPRRFQAWLDLEQITEAEFDAFVGRLQTQILTKATPVTNHGCFPNGGGECPFTIQSVLGPGTPVWYDPQQRRIVAKCMCSNPLTDPQCPPNCEDIPSPTPSPTPTEQPTIPPTSPPTPTPTLSPSPTPVPTPTPVRTVTPLPSPTKTATQTP